MEEKNYEEVENKENVSESEQQVLSNDENLDLALKELEETKDRLKRIAAEFDNYKKRTAKEKEMLYTDLVSEIIVMFLPVIDNLEKAVMAKTSDEEFKKGVEMVLKQIMDILSYFKVEEIETVGKTFDPEVHEAVSSIMDDTKGEKEIVQEFRKGYKIGTKVLRHSMVVVAN